MRDEVVGFFAVSQNTEWSDPQVTPQTPGYVELSTPQKTGSGLECFQVVDNPSQCRMMDIVWKWPDNPSQFEGQQQFKLIDDVFPPWHCVNTNLNTLHWQTAKTSVTEAYHTC